MLGFRNALKLREIVLFFPEFFQTRKFGFPQWGTPLAGRSQNTLSLSLAGVLNNRGNDILVKLVCWRAVIVSNTRADR